MRKKLFAVGTTVLAASLLLNACSSSSSSESTSSQASGSQPSGSGQASGAQPTGDPIIIGMDEDSTGPGASYSTIAGQTVRDAIDQVNAEGGILGRPVQLVVENDESDPTKTPSVLRKLLDAGSVALILQSSGAAIAQAKPVVEEAGVISIAPTSISQSVGLPPDNTYTYTLANPLSDFVKVYCGAFDAKGFKTLGVLSDGSVTIDAVNQLLLPGLGDCIKIVAEEKAPVDAADLSAQVARIKEANPDTVLVSSVGGNFEVLAQNTLAQQMPDTQRFSLASIGNQPSSWKLANPGALDGLVYMGSLSSDNPQTAKLQEFLNSARGGDYSVTAYDAQGYDTVQLIKMAIEKAGSTDKAKVSEAMNSITGYLASFGQPGFELSYNADKHLGADGLCGLVLTQFGPDNTPTGPWADYQAPC